MNSSLYKSVLHVMNWALKLVWQATNYSRFSWIAVTLLSYSCSVTNKKKQLEAMGINIKYIEYTIYVVHRSSSIFTWHKNNKNLNLDDKSKSKYRYLQIIGARAPAPLRSDAKLPLPSGLCDMNDGCVDMCRAPSPRGGTIPVAPKKIKSRHV